MNTLELGFEIRNTINAKAANNPRSLQTTIGPSEVGSPCVRRIGYKLAGVERTNQPDQWLATIGTAVHTWLAETFGDNSNYLVEHRVHVTPTLAGSVDLYDFDRKLVLDWKIVGDSSLKRYKSQGPGDQYRTQTHLYGMGLMNAGYDVTHVGIAFLPRGGSLRGLHIWVEEYDPTIALSAIARLDLAKSAIESAGTKALVLLPAIDSHCHFCPYFLPGSTDVEVGCPGGETNPTQPNKGEIA